MDSLEMCKALGRLARTARHSYPRNKGPEVGAGFQSALSGSRLTNGVASLGLNSFASKLVHLSHECVGDLSFDFAMCTVTKPTTCAARTPPTV